MAFDRPTFSESWYRVAELKPRLRSLVQAYRQYYRGDQWMVLRDPGNNKFYRLDDANYRFLGLLDGRRTVDAVWQQVQEELGDRAATQGEAIQLLGQLYTSNLVEAEVPADAAGMFERYRKRKRREVGGYLMNILFARIPIFDPEPILARWIKVTGWLFSPVGIALWLVLLGFALFQLAPRSGELMGSYGPNAAAGGVLSPGNLPYLYVMLILTKLVHEFGHGFCCKHFGLRNHSGGEVHTLGIMLMAFMPVPYVDASSSWAFRNKWQRAFVGAAGMYVEIMMAAVGAIVWVNTEDGTLAHKLAYNVIFIAGVSTLLFNANPLIRFDGYYILSDILEMPNLAQRSKEYAYYLVKKYVYKVQRPRDPSHSPGEKVLLLIYYFASGIYRIFITVAILLFVMSFEIFFFLGAIAAIMGVVSFILAPIAKWWHYVLTNPEVQRTRRLAFVTTAVFFTVMILLIGVIRLPEYGRASGVIESSPVPITDAVLLPQPSRAGEARGLDEANRVQGGGAGEDGDEEQPLAGDYVVFTQTEGFVAELRPSGTRVRAGDVLVRGENPRLEADLAAAEARLRAVAARYDQTVAEQPAEADVLLERRRVIQDRIDQLRDDLSKLTLIAPFDGEWVVGANSGRTGQLVSVGDPIGVLVHDSRRVRVVAGQAFGPRLVGTENARVTLRVRGRPDQVLTGRIEHVSIGGSRELPSQALGYGAGGDIELDMEDQSGRMARESMYAVSIALDEDSVDPEMIRTGQRVVARFRLGNAPAIVQGWRMLVRAYRERRQA